MISFLTAPLDLLRSFASFIGIDVGFTAPGGENQETTSLTRLPAAEPLSREARQALGNISNTDNSRRVQIGQLTIIPKEEVGPDYLGRVLASEALS